MADPWTVQWSLTVTVWSQWNSGRTGECHQLSADTPPHRPVHTPELRAGSLDTPTTTITGLSPRACISPHVWSTAHSTQSAAVAPASEKVMSCCGCGCSSSCCWKVKCAEAVAEEAVAAAEAVAWLLRWCWWADGPYVAAAAAAAAAADGATMSVWTPSWCRTCMHSQHRPATTPKTELVTAGGCSTIGEYRSL
jgi:hypothetical protein